MRILRDMPSLDRTPLWGLLFLLCCGFHPLQASDTCRLAFRIPRPVLMAQADAFGNLFVVTPRQELFAYDSTGRKEWFFVDVLAGELSQVDVSNPLNILAYYRDYQIVYVLDRTLNVIARYDLTALQFPRVRHLALANDNRLWIFDEIDRKLKKIDNRGMVVAESVPFHQLSDSFVDVERISESENMVTVWDRKGNAWIFDNFGQWDRTLPIPAPEASPGRSECSLPCTENAVQLPAPPYRLCVEAARTLVYRIRPQ